jgi:hypothetical protein
MSQSIMRYGVPWNIMAAKPAQEIAAIIELEMIRHGGYRIVDGKRYGLGEYEHIKAFAKIAWPWFYWHRWNEMEVRAFCDCKRVCVWGAASSQKTSTAAMWALTKYFSRPRGTSVLVCTTTREMLDMRIWGEIKMFWKKAKERLPSLPGHITDSKQTITTDGKEVEGREFRDGVIGRPVKKGNEWVGLGDLVGIKNDVVIVIADEYHLVPDSVGRSIANLSVNPSCTFVSLGNLNDLSTPLGQEAEPKLGWDGLADSEKARIYDTRWSGGKAIQLPGCDSPNLDHPEGSEPYTKLIGRRFLKECQENYGLDTPLYNMFAGGKVPRGTMENRVITKAICLKFQAFDEVTWGAKPVKKLYCGDISYTFSHGDRSVGIPLAFGEDVEGEMRLALLESPKVMTPNDRKEGTVEEQLALQYKEECERYGIGPECFFYDGTGRSSFTAAMMRLWSTLVQPVEFGGNASERVNFMGRKWEDGPEKGDLKKCKDVFGKFVSELWFAFRFLVEAGQCRGLTDTIIKEAAMRLYVIGKSNKMDVEPKAELKTRLGRSCDLADAFCVGIEGARRLGFPLGKLKPDKPAARSRWHLEASQKWEKLAKGKELEMA